MVEEYSFGGNYAELGLYIDDDRNIIVTNPDNYTNIQQTLDNYFLYIRNYYNEYFRNWLINIKGNLFDRLERIKQIIGQEPIILKFIKDSLYIFTKDKRILDQMVAEKLVLDTEKKRKRSSDQNEEPIPKEAKVESSLSSTEVISSSQESDTKDTLQSTSSSTLSTPRGLSALPSTSDSDTSDTTSQTATPSDTDASDNQTMDKADIKKMAIKTDEFLINILPDVNERKQVYSYLVKAELPIENKSSSCIVS